VKWAVSVSGRGVDLSISCSPAPKASPALWSRRRKIKWRRLRPQTQFDHVRLPVQTLFFNNIYIYIHTHIYIHIHTHTHKQIYIIYTHTHTHIYIYMYINLNSDIITDLDSLHGTKSCRKFYSVLQHNYTIMTRSIAFT